VVVSLILLAGVLLYLFGTPQAPVPAQQVATPGSGAAHGGSESDAASDEGEGSGPPMGGEVPEGAEAPPPDPDSPLAIEIPGCTCHSDDPQIVAEHAEYRMNQCAGCHIGGGPPGG
jgi:hypothetical protein